MGDLWVAAILGIVEGLTEFLPVSSTGHLIVVGDLLKCSGEKAACFEVFIQLGAILAVVVLYWKRFTGLVPGRAATWTRSNGFSGVQGLVLLALTTLPALFAGALLHKLIKQHLFSPVSVAWALGIGGIAIIVAEWLKPEPRVKDLDRLGYGAALAIGVFQCLAMWPGVSRSAATIVGGMFSGLDRRTATEYSFLAAVPVMMAATSYDLYKSWHFLELSDIGFFAIGFVVSFVSAVAAVKTFIELVQRWSLVPYALYRIGIAPLIYLYFSW